MGRCAATASAAAPDIAPWAGVATVQPHWRAHAPSRLTPAAMGAGQIHLWAVYPQPLLATHMGLLSAPELVRAQRYRKAAVRARYLGGRIGLRLLLAGYTGLPNHGLRFAAGARGKPRLLHSLEGETLGFNYSLSGAMALYAFARGRCVGVDMEQAPRAVATTPLARRILAAAERRAWQGIAPAERARALLACWTRKEAYGKALGVGIRYRLGRVPLFVALQSPDWQCRARGLFDGERAEGSPQAVFHGLQLAPPGGIAALVYDGAALAAPAAPWLQAWRWNPAAE